MKIILYQNRKTDPCAWDAHTPKLRTWALLQLFNLLDEQECYYDLHGWEEDDYYVAILHMMKELYDQAKKGNAESAERLLLMRKQYEYEYWSELEVEEPGPLVQR